MTPWRHNCDDDGIENNLSFQGGSVIRSASWISHTNSVWNPHDCNFFLTTCCCTKGSHVLEPKKAIFWRRVCLAELEARKVELFDRTSVLFIFIWFVLQHLTKNKCIRAYLCNYHQRRPKSVHSVVLLRMISWAAAVLLGGHGISNAVKKMARTLPIRGLKALRHVHKVFRLQVFMMEKASLYQTQHERERTCCAAIPSLHVFLRVYNRMICFF